MAYVLNGQIKILHGHNKNLLWPIILVENVFSFTLDVSLRVIWIGVLFILG